ncbi:ABC transporter permease [Alicyclobacillus shizuokensis]|uniref:ABC transporter permease n=1 Tax=Alicyclobacillus shizuokensis TaxID=392014 RepID=UPI0008310C64|nr:ABC transporter permease [Alicyclobacillus shizuokensis]
MRAFWIWIEREFKLRTRSKGYWIFTIIGLVMLVAFTFLPSLLNWLQRNTKTEVLIADPQQIVAPMLQKRVKAAPDRFDFRLSTTKTAGVSRFNQTHMQTFMRDHHVSLVVAVNGDKTTDASFVIEENGTIDPSTLQSLQTLLQQSVTQARISTLPQASQATLGAPIKIDMHQWKNGAKSTAQIVQSEIVVYFMLILLFVTVIMYGNWVAQGVVEEKSNRIIEMMLITSKPWQILFGKVIGIALIGLLQYAIWMTVVGCVRLISDNMGGRLLHSVPISTLAWFAVFFVIGYFLWAIGYGVAGSLVTRAEEQQMAVSPVVLATLIVFYLELFAVLPHPDSLFSKVLSFIPMVSPFSMPARLALSDVPVWEVCAAIVLNIACAWLLVRIGARVYSRFALRTSGRLKWRNLWKVEQADVSE